MCAVEAGCVGMCSEYTARYVLTTVCSKSVTVCWLQCVHYSVFYNRYSVLTTVCSLQCVLKALQCADYSVFTILCSTSVTVCWLQCVHYSVFYKRWYNTPSPVQKNSLLSFSFPRWECLQFSTRLLVCIRNPTITPCSCETEVYMHISAFVYKYIARQHVHIVSLSAANAHVHTVC